jgi:hypothetical protein
MIGLVPRLLERAAELHRLHSAVDRAAAGRGVTVLVTANLESERQACSKRSSPGWGPGRESWPACAKTS